MILKRRSLLLSSFALLASPARASLSSVDLALLDGETIPYHCEQIAHLASRIAWLFEYLEDTARAPIARHVAAVAVRTFQPAQTLLTIQDHLASLPSPAYTEELVAAFNRYADAMDQDFPVHFGSAEDIANINERCTKSVLSRPDHADVAALTALTPSVAIGVAPRLAAHRLYNAVHVLAGLDAAGFRPQTRTDWNNVIDDICSETFASTMEDINASQVRASLSTLPATDIAALLAFYNSHAGQARRAAIAKIIEAQVDHDTRSTIMTYLEERYTQPEPVGGWYPAPQYTMVPPSSDPPPKVVTVSSTARSSPSRKLGLDHKQAR